MESGSGIPFKHDLIYDLDNKSLSDQVMVTA